MTRFLLICSLFALWSALLPAQTIFPGLLGEELADSLRAHYRPQHVLTYSEARDTLWANIDSQNDSLYCVYTGYGIELDPAEDPTQDAFSKGINTEHTYPRGRGADFGNARSDMHHLYPTLVEVNSDRGNLPFGDIADHLVDDWYYLTQEMSSTPAAHKERYSRRRQSQRFQPRDDHKGNVARAMFYFWTIYRSEAQDADPGYFEPQREDLCQWHLDDPVDQRELMRSTAIADYQDGKENPFVLDCDLVRRTYCPDLPQLMCLSSTSDLYDDGPSYLRLIGVSPRPDRRVVLEVLEATRLNVAWYDMLGRQVGENSFDLLKVGQYDLPAPADQSAAPLVARLSWQQAGRWYMQSVVLP